MDEQARPVTLLSVTAVAAMILAGVFSSPIDNGTRGYVNIPATLSRVSKTAQAPQVFQLGSFTAQWSPQTQLFQVTHAAMGTTPVWSTESANAFVTAQWVTAKIDGAHGDYTLVSDLQDTLSQQSVDSVTMTNGVLTISGSLESTSSSLTWPYTLLLEAKEENQLGFTVEIQPTSEATQARVLISFRSEANEHFYGLGSQTHLTQEGRLVPIVVREQGHGRGKEPLSFFMNMRNPGIAGNDVASYAPVPYLLTSLGRGFFLENSEISLFDMQEEKLVSVMLVGPQMRGRFIAGGNVASVVESYTAYAGRQKPLPHWINEGAVIGVQGGSDKVRRAHELLRKAAVPVAAVWIQDWVGPRHTPNGTFLNWNWALDDTLYPDFAALTLELRRDGIRTMTYFNPFLVQDLPRQPGKISMFSQAASGGLLVNSADQKPYMMPVWQGDSALLDLTNPNARTFMKAAIKEHIQSFHVSGWMGDFGEALPFDGVLANRASPWSEHNLYAERWSALQSEAVAELGLQEEVVFFNRCGYTHSPGHTPLFWLGDQMVTWDEYDGIKSAVVQLLSSGLSGFALNHTDIGGYLAVDRWPIAVVRSKELLMRWMELAAFTSVFRTHEGSLPTKNWQFADDRETLEQLARFADVYAQLADYRESLMHEAFDVGYPLVRPMFFHYGDDAAAWTADRQFTLGPDLLVAPVLDQGAKHTQVYFPAGTWRPYFGGPAETYATATWQDVATPMGKPAVYIRDGSALRAYSPSNLR